MARSTAEAELRLHLSRRRINGVWAMTTGRSASSWLQQNWSALYGVVVLVSCHNAGDGFHFRDPEMEVLIWALSLRAGSIFWEELAFGEIPMYSCMNSVRSRKRSACFLSSDGRHALRSCSSCSSSSVSSPVGTGRGHIPHEAAVSVTGRNRLPGGWSTMDSGSHC
ncbi:hypothetical protein BT67DRAFT_311598 [Trichocladium antarcticum]|uniref:Uncharacterized protein n=1 Tax=Trichocladium antarcticum TaxID=1450529 RepID=A0AAN6ZDE5_9PEZI|nr:hypothetical protein BT67DRAFT_311598 [Trichocladium antarcticum]